ncbi:MAG: bifunctional adenosylcobinamide kinase/adenosylcobinamide-phosphate guanylyltransferase [Proteobacteria bacterium]|nr:bifunctional adenosylcobinamide kinase/adenosylcobinamide-phosphate guanylyltransferase [Pseudomonadota bacterium]
MKHKITLVTGGSRSGKSTFALSLAEPFSNKAFLATAQAFDKEMETRILRHQKEREDRFRTIEEPIEIANVIQRIHQTNEIMIIDCLTVWLGNLMHKFSDVEGDYSQIKELYRVLEEPPCDLIIVTNEVGLGIIPSNELSRKFRDYAGLLNQKVASLSDDVYLTVSGIPVKIK